MASGHIQALLSPPSDADAHKRTRDYPNVRFKTFQDVESSDEFDELVANAHTRDEELKGKVRSAVIISIHLPDTTVIA
jgi:RAD50-interacting protein 1